MQKANNGRYLGMVLKSRMLTNFVLVESTYTAGQELSWHSHERAFISIALEGSYLERCGASSLYCDVGQVILHTAGELHCNRFFEQGGRSLNLEILPHFAERLLHSGVDIRKRITMSGRDYARIGRKLHLEATCYDSAAELAIEGLAMEVLASVVRSQGVDVRPRRSNWLEGVLSLLTERYRETLTLKDIAEEAQVHPVHLARTFKSRYGCSIGDYVRRLRVDAACDEIVGSDLSIAEIAARNGFSDQSHLCRSVKEQTGASPGQLRRNVRCSATLTART